MKKKIIIGVILIIIIIGGISFYLYQYTEVFGKKIIPIKINTITMHYVPGYSLDEANLLNIDKDKEIVKVQEIKLSKEEIKEISKYLKKLKKKDKQSKKDNNKLYELIINKTVLDIYNKDGLATRDKEKTKVVISKELYDYIDKIINKYQKELLNEYKFEEVSFHYNKASISIKNNKNLIKDELLFYPIEMDTNYKEYNNGYDIDLVIDKDLHIYLYNNKIAYIVDKRDGKDDKYYAICVNRLYEILSKIYDKSTK